MFWHGEAGRVARYQLKGFEPAARWNWAAFFFGGHGDQTDWLEWRDCSERRAYFEFERGVVRAQARVPVPLKPGRRFSGGPRKTRNAEIRRTRLDRLSRRRWWIGTSEKSRRDAGAAGGTARRGDFVELNRAGIEFLYFKEE